MSLDTEQREKRNFRSEDPRAGTRSGRNKNDLFQQVKMMGQPNTEAPRGWGRGGQGTIISFLSFFFFFGCVVWLAES